MLAVVTWKWGKLFSAQYVNTMRSMLARHLQLPHRLYCVTDDPAEIDREVVIVPMPRQHADTPRCRRRMWMYARERRELWGDRMLAIDLDMVILRDITDLVDRPEPIVMWRVGYARVLSGSVVLCDTGALDGAWQRYRDDPHGFPAACGERYASDQAMLGLYLRDRQIAEWADEDGLVTWFGRGYERLQRYGMGPSRPNPPEHARIVVLGSADISILEERRYPWTQAWQ